MAEPMESPEVALWRAVILRAIEDGCGNFASEALNRAVIQGEARAFFNPRDGNFVAVCDAAGLDASWVAARAAERAAERFRRADEEADEGADREGGSRRRRRRGLNAGKEPKVPSAQAEAGL